MEAYDRYVSTSMKQAWSLRNKYECWLAIEKKIIEFLVDAKKCYGGAFEEISSIQITDDTIKEIQMKESIIKHDVLAFVETIAGKLSAKTGAAFHRGLTSSDLVDTANGIIMSKSISLVMSEQFRLCQAITDLSNKYGHLYQVGRTHGMHTEPIKLSHKFNIWLDEAMRNNDRLELAADHVRVGKLSGPIGNRAYDIDIAAEQDILSGLGLRVETSANQVVQRDRYAFVSAVLGIVARSASTIATEVRHLSRPEIGEMSEGHDPGYKGSSAMPHKINPITSENICGLARVVSGYVVPMMESQVLWGERDISHSSVERATMPLMFGLTETLLKRTTSLINKIHIYPDKLEKNMNLLVNINLSARLLYKLQCAGVHRNVAYNLTTAAVNDKSINNIYRMTQNKDLMAHLTEEDLKDIYRTQDDSKTTNK